MSDRVVERGLEPLFIDMKGAEWIAEDRLASGPGRAEQNFQRNPRLRRRRLGSPRIQFEALGGHFDLNLVGAGNLAGFEPNLG